MTVTQLLEMLNRFKTIGFGDVVVGVAYPEQEDNLAINSVVLNTHGPADGWVEIVAS